MFRAAVVFCYLLVVSVSCSSASENVSTVCGEHFFDEHVILQSSNYPNPYPDRSNCLYEIHGPKCNTTFNVDFVDFDIEESERCQRDYLMIQGIKYCGVMSGKRSYVADSGILYLQFVTDLYQAGRGFQIVINRTASMDFAKQTGLRMETDGSQINTFGSQDYRPSGHSVTTEVDISTYEPFMSNNPVHHYVSHRNKRDTKCTDLSLLFGVLLSLGHPICYFPNQNTCWRIWMLPRHCFLKVHLKDFQLEESGECTKDHLDLGSKGRFCGTSLQDSISIFDMRSDRYVEVRFVSNSSICGKGFSGTFKQVRCNSSEAQSIINFLTNATVPAASTPDAHAASPEITTTPRLENNENTSEDSIIVFDT